MRKAALEFIASCEQSYAGKDYLRDFGYNPGKWKAMKNMSWEIPASGKKKEKKAGKKKK